MTNTAATSSSYSAAHRTKLFQEMEIQFDTKNQDYFAKLLNHSDSIIRTRAICILADIAGENAVSPISKVLRDDENALVRHEAAFSLGQLGFSGGINALTQAVKRDPSLFVRHESAIALGVIGSEDARDALEYALSDKSEEVRESAMTALANLDYVKTMKRNNRFTKMTGG